MKERWRKVLVQTYCDPDSVANQLGPRGGIAPGRLTHQWMEETLVDIVRDLPCDLVRKIAETHYADILLYLDEIAADLDGEAE